MINPQRMDLLVAFCIILFHPSAIYAVIDDDSIVKINDDRYSNLSEAHRQFHTLVLENGMKIVLIKDATAWESSAHLNVHGISINDPSDIIGMNRFVEKMILTSPGKYPNGESSSSYLSRRIRRGESFPLQAATAFQFNVGHEYFQEALNLFGQCFIQPRFHGRDIEEQVEEVRVEYMVYDPHELLRSNRLRKAICDNETCHFIPDKVNSLWNIYKLNSTNLSMAAENFFNEYYSSDSMTLIVISPESLDNMRQMVLPLFSKVINRSQNSGHKIRNQLITTDNFVGKLVNMESASEDDQYWIVVTFPTPDFANLTMKGTEEYLRRLLTYAGNGSFLKNLKDKDIIRNIEIRPEFSSRTEFNMLTIDLETSPDAFHNLTVILESLISFLAAVKERHNNEEWLYDNMRSLRMHAFDIDVS